MNRSTVPYHILYLSWKANELLFIYKNDNLMICERESIKHWYWLGTTNTPGRDPIAFLGLYQSG